MTAPSVERLRDFEDAAVARAIAKGQRYTVHALGWFTGRRKVLSAHWSLDGPTGAQVAAAELVRQEFQEVEVVDQVAGRRWQL
jgi:hypothetical protein